MQFLFDHIQLLWLTALVPAIILFLLAVRWKARIRKAFGEPRFFNQLVQGYSAKKFYFRFALIIVALALLGFSMSNPRKPVADANFKLSGLDVMMVLDVSNSMLSKDVAPSRLDKAKLFISKTIDRLQGNRVGLIVFAGNAYVQMPLTSDASATKLFLQSIGPELVPTQGTNIGAALRLADRSMNLAEKKYKAAILITDGEDHDEQALAAAEEIKKNGVVVEAVGIGSPGGSPIMDNTGQPRRDDQGNVIVSRLNEKILQDIAKTTGGKYIFLDEPENAVTQIAGELQGMDKKPISDTSLVNFTSFAPWLVGIALLALVIELFVGEKKKNTMTKRNDTPAPPKKESALSMAKMLLALLVLSCTGNALFAQKANTLVRKGNEAYKKQQFGDAEKSYDEALKLDSGNTTAAYNLANAKFRGSNFADAAKQYDAAAYRTTNKNVQAQAYNNKGLALIKDKKIEEAVDAFKQSMRLNPGDNEVRENLQKALKELQQKQEQEKKDKEDKKDDKKKDEDKKDKKDQDKKDKDDKQQQQQPPPPSKFDKKEAEQKLQALQQEEKKIRQKLNEQKRPASAQPLKDW